MASPLQPLTVRGTRRVWYISCYGPSEVGGCVGADIAAIEVSGSTDVFVRSATDAERQLPQYASLVAFLIAGDADDPVVLAPSVASVDLDAASGLRTLFVGSFAGASSVEVVLLERNTVQQVSAKGSGDLTVGDHVLARSGDVVISTVGSADLFVTSSDAMGLTRLDIHSAASADMQVSLGLVQAVDMAVTAGSGNILLFTSSIDVSGSAVVSSTGSGDVCWMTRDEMSIAALQVAGMSSADIAISSDSASASSCGNLKVQSVGSGDIDVGGIRCKTAKVEMFGSSDIVVQASDSIDGDAVGSGSVRYAGVAPSSIGRSYLGVIARPVKSSYQRPTCKQLPVQQYPSDDNVLLTGHVGTGAVTAQGGGEAALPSSDPPNVEPSPPLSSPGSELRHLNSLFPLGVVALIAAFALWGFNKRRSGRRRQYWDSFDDNRGFGRDDDARGEKQPLASEHRPVYI